MESRACGGCSRSSFLTLTTTSEDQDAPLERLAYFQLRRDTPPMPLVEGQERTEIADGTLQLSFYELWNSPLWKRLFGEEPTIEKINEIANTGVLRLSKIIKSPSAVMRARIYDAGTLVFIPDDDERCEGIPTLHKNIVVRYQKTSIS